MFSGTSLTVFNPAATGPGGAIDTLSSDSTGPAISCLFLNCPPGLGLAVPIGSRSWYPHLALSAVSQLLTGLSIHHCTVSLQSHSNLEASAIESRVGSASLDVRAFSKHLTTSLTLGEISSSPSARGQARNHGRRPECQGWVENGGYLGNQSTSEGKPTICSWGICEKGVDNAEHQL